MAMIGRLLWVGIAAFTAAVIGALVVVTLGLELATRAGVTADGLAAAQGDAEALLRTWYALFETADPLWSLLLTLSVLPAIFVVIIGEVSRIRSLLYYLIGGGIAAAGIPALMRLSQGPIAGPQSTALLVLATGGFAAGLAYWALAGRRA